MMVVALVGNTVRCSARIPPEFVPPDDDALYGDLMEDPDAARFLAVLLHVKTPSGIRPTDEELAEVDWVQNQESRAYPLIVEILKRENDFVYGLPRKSDALAYVIGSDRGGDKSVVLEEMRKQLPAWNKKYSRAFPTIRSSPRL